MPDKDSQPEKKEENSSSFEEERDAAQTWIRDLGRFLTRLTPLQQTARILIQWAPMGSSGFVLASFLLKQNWVVAIAAFPALIITVIWAAYTESILARLQEIFQEKGTKDVDRIMAWLGWQLAGTEEKYLRCQKSACRDYTTEGHKPALSIFIPVLDEVFVPLELSNRFLRNFEGDCLPMPASLRWDKEVRERIKRAEGLRIWDLLKKVREVPSYRRMAILAWGGYGKTTLLRHVTYLYSYKKQPRNVPKLLPVLFYLRSQQERMVEGKLDLPQLIEKHHIPGLPQGNELNLPPNWVKNLLREGKMLVMFDGFDEVKEQQQKSVSLWIGKQMREYPKSVFILTSRPAGYKNFIAEDRFGTEVFVKSFNDDQKERFIRRWYLCQERYARGGRNTPEVKQAANQNALNLLGQIHEGKRSELKELAKNPLMLNMIVSLHRCYPGENLPRRRAELYREIIRLQLGDRPLARNIDTILSAEESQKVLQALALDMVYKDLTEVGREVLLKRLQHHLEQIDDSVDVVQFLKEIEQVSELLVKKDENYIFSHVSFRNFLAASAIREWKQEKLLLESWHKTEGWRETVLLYTALVNPVKIVRELLADGSREAIDLAYKCLQETPRKVDPKLAAEIESLREDVTDKRYEKLEEYLKNGEWKNADNETYIVMIQVVGKEAGDLFEKEDIDNFPCDDLRTIDNLWLKYSNGHFGFSVQKEIWLEEGGEPGVYDRVILEKFGDRVQWRKNKVWKFSEIQFNLSAPRGHLPFWCFVGGGGHLPFRRGVAWLFVGVASGISFLAQRLVDCRIQHSQTTVK
ncbi:MAG: GUN4 domain-containing protein [Cyanobacteria bacterium SBLK]|nr:GUN4 domain-containing protein [Cyanobacteria bacterium SBLK]